jgi:hypothetical protein
LRSSRKLPWQLNSQSLGEHASRTSSSVKSPHRALNGPCSSAGPPVVGFQHGRRAGKRQGRNRRASEPRTQARQSSCRGAARLGPEPLHGRRLSRQRPPARWASPPAVGGTAGGLGPPSKSASRETPPRCPSGLPAGRRGMQAHGGSPARGGGERSYPSGPPAPRKTRHRGPRPAGQVRHRGREACGPHGPSGPNAPPSGRRRPGRWPAVQVRQPVDAAPLPKRSAIGSYGGAGAQGESGPRGREPRGARGWSCWPVRRSKNTWGRVHSGPHPAAGRKPRGDDGVVVAHMPVPRAGPREDRQEGPREIRLGGPRKPAQRKKMSRPGGEAMAAGCLHPHSERRQAEHTKDRLRSNPRSCSAPVDSFAIGSEEVRAAAAHRPPNTTLNSLHG